MEEGGKENGDGNVGTGNDKNNNQNSKQTTTEVRNNDSLKTEDNCLNESISRKGGSNNDGFKKYL
eukprot:11328294-Ditylum_brightwellii.AAC.1